MSEGTWMPMLRAFAHQNRAAHVERGPHGEVSVGVERKRRLPAPLVWIVPFQKQSVTRLDAVGSRIWSLCDGRRTVGQVVDAIATEYQLTFHESRVAVTGYIKTLLQRGVLAIETEGMTCE
jgi:hypothetical protein